MVLDTLLRDGVDVVTHSRVAAQSGYSKATIYKHWPTRAALIAEALLRVGEVEHHTTDGHLPTDLFNELLVYRDEMEKHQLDRALVTLVSLLPSMPELEGVRIKLVTDGERTLRRILSTRLEGEALEAATLMMVGSILQSALLHGKLPSRELVRVVVDTMLRSMDAPQDPASS
ncbi:TetR/AcrR family transcriptional regulator [Nocardioides marmoraquaticus]